MMCHNQAGQVACGIWQKIPDQFPYAKLGARIVMPNHMHGILQLSPEWNEDAAMWDKLLPKFSTPVENRTGEVTGQHNPMLHKNLGRVIRWYKGRVSYEIRKLNLEFAWQPNYYERIILHGEMYDKITAYINNNPAKWAEGKTERRD